MSHSERTFELPGVGPKTYRFPTRFHEVEVLGAVTMVDAALAERWLPSPLRPVRLPGARALMLFTVQEFLRPAEFPGYREAAIAVMATSGRGRGFHVLTMPVTSEENLARGPKIFGLPKELAEVTLSDAGRTRVGEVHVGGERLFRLEVRPRVGLFARVPVRSRYLQLHEGAPSHVDTRGDARLQVGGARLEPSPLLARRCPGFPASPKMLGAFRLSAGELALHLPVAAR